MLSLAVVALQQWLGTSDCLFLKLEGERGQESVDLKSTT